MLLKFLGYLLLAFLGFVQADWNDIAYEKKYDELEGEAFFAALKADQKSRVVLNILPQYRDKLTPEEYDFYTLWAAIETNSEQIQTLLRRASASPRVTLLKAHYYISSKQDASAFEQVEGLEPAVQNLECLELYLRLGLLSKAEALFAYLVAGSEPTYNFLNALQSLQKLDKSAYLRWMEMLRLGRPQDDLSHQLWVEVSPQYGAWTSGNALRDYCRLNVLYCYNVSEYLRQNGSPAEAWLWSYRISSLRDATKFKIHAFIDAKNYVEISLLDENILGQGLIQEERYAYALYYSYYIQGRCEEAKALKPGLLASKSYAERVMKMSARCP